MNQMSAAQVPNYDEVQSSVPEGIRVMKNLNRLYTGSCNACTSISKNPNAYDKVTEVHLRGMSIRLCPSCHQLLKKAL